VAVLGTLCAAAPQAGAQRARIVVRGAVQGVGFRPHAYRLAAEFALGGWVSNSVDGVLIEVEGRAEAIDAFVHALEARRPASARIEALETVPIAPRGESAFAIRGSRREGALSAAILPDLATCAECLRELLDPQDRRYLYPFTNCTHCGPRYSILQTLPYDRAGTTMSAFAMCPACRAEYDDPADRRFHAQPNACPACGPSLALWDAAGRTLAERHDALLQAARTLREGGIVAVKGLGGFHLWTDARDAPAVARLRRRKARAEKPFALMFPALEAVRAHCELSPQEARLLEAAPSPIVLLARRAAPEPAAPAIADQVAPGSPELGAMLPYTPLHYLLMRELGFPVVATSGNRSEEPIAIDEREALERLHGIADLFLVHDRPIARAVEDSVVRVVLGRELVLRRGRGYAPYPLPLPDADPRASLLATGAHLKSTVSLLVAGRIVTSGHLGDLETPEAREGFEQAARDLTQLYRAAPVAVACDLHPDYASTCYAERSGLQRIEVQHHVAHVAACMAENGLRAPVLGVAWDGTGYGTDGTIWGGEFLLVGAGAEVRRVAHLRRFRLPGGERAVREPRRAALGVLYEAFGERILEEAGDLAPLRSFDAKERRVLRAMLASGSHAPLTSSAGRLFDAAAALAGLRQTASYEGQAAMELEWRIDDTADFAPYPLELLAAGGDDTEPFIVDWGPMVRRIAQDVRGGVSSGAVAAAFHRALAAAIVAVAERIGVHRVALTGGCFQNRHLLEWTVRCLREQGFAPFWHRQVPPNDGGISVGQAAFAAARLRKG
jgi:hydrogenase maturation protein HypF